MPSKAYKTFQKNLNQVNKLIETYNHELERNSGRGNTGRRNGRKFRRRFQRVICLWEDCCNCGSFP